MLFLIFIVTGILEIPSVLGELSADILLGISGFGIIEVNDFLKVFAEIGRLNGI